MRIRKIYTADVPEGHGDLEVRVEAEETAELYAGEKLIGAAFWAPQIFRISGKDRENGTMKLKLVVTGSLANRYGRPVEYGLWKG